MNTEHYNNVLTNVGWESINGFTDKLILELDIETAPDVCDILRGTINSIVSSIDTVTNIKYSNPDADNHQIDIKFCIGNIDACYLYFYLDRQDGPTIRTTISSY